MKVNSVSKRFFGNSILQFVSSVEKTTQRKSNLAMTSYDDFCKYIDKEMSKSLLTNSNKVRSNITMSSIDDFCGYFDSKLFGFKKN